MCTCTTQDMHVNMKEGKNQTSRNEILFTNFDESSCKQFETLALDYSTKNAHDLSASIFTRLSDRMIDQTGGIKFGDFLLR